VAETGRWPTGQMPNFYFDESIQTNAQFIVGAYVYGLDAETAVAGAIECVGLRPGIDEFKSSARMSEHPEQVRLRGELFEVIRSYRIGVLVAPITERTDLWRLALEGLDQIARANRLAGTVELDAALDEGLFASTQEASRVIEASAVHAYCAVRSEQDSRQVKGLQLADLVAHTVGIMLLDSLGLVTKTVTAGPNSGYDEDLDIGLGFYLWAGLRYQFFKSGPVPDQDEIYNGALMSVGLNGLYVAPSCSDELRAAADERFGQCYVGCVH